MIVGRDDSKRFLSGFRFNGCCGADDGQLLPQNAEGMEEYVTTLEVRIIERVDHWITHKAPAEIAAAVRALNSQTQ